MSEHSILKAFVALTIISGFSGMAAGQYWFQSGAQGGSQTMGNSGGSISIQTISPQNVTRGSLGYWIGETLDNGAFIQVGYQIANSSGIYNVNCPGICNSSVTLQAGEPTWFWEYFQSGSNSSKFYGGIGPTGSVGRNGAFNNYAFNSSGTTWTAYVNGNAVGSVNLGAVDSGGHLLLAAGEYADAQNNTYSMPIVQFKNMMAYIGGQWEKVPIGYSYISYGAGSEQALPNTYGVGEVGNSTNYFEVGSGLPLMSASKLWSVGYSLTVSSEYPVGGSSGNYTAYSRVFISVPTPTVNISNTSEVVFVGWKGNGIGSYSGPSNNASVLIAGNITEKADWLTLYRINISTNFDSNVTDSGWYSIGQNATLSVGSGIVATGEGTRELFRNWSNGSTNKTLDFVVTHPINLTVDWVKQYYLNATSPYGTVSGGGWYDANSTAVVALSKTYVDQSANGSRTGFYSWSNGNYSQTLSLNMTSPQTIRALFQKQYLVSVQLQDSYGNPIQASYYVINGTRFNSSGIYLFTNRSYTLQSASYKGTNVRSGYNIGYVSPLEHIVVKLPVYNITVGAAGLFGMPLNAVYNLTFRNGTTISGNLGPDGSITLHDVPYGYAFGMVKFLGEARGVSFALGGAYTTTFITPTLFAGIIISIIGILLAERYYFSRRRKKDRDAAMEAARRARRR